MYPLLSRINAYLVRLVRWIRKKYKRLRAKKNSGAGAGSSSESRACSRTGNGFLPPHLPGDQDDKSPVTGDCYAGICGSVGLKCPGPSDRLGYQPGRQAAGAAPFPDRAVAARQDPRHRSETTG
jgi:hypothetical protein